MVYFFLTCHKRRRSPIVLSNILRPCARAALPQKARIMFDDALISAARISKAWPFQEAMKLARRFPEGKRDAG